MKIVFEGHEGYKVMHNNDACWNGNVGDHNTYYLLSPGGDNNSFKVSDYKVNNNTHLIWTMVPGNYTGNFWFGNIGDINTPDDGRDFRVGNPVNWSNTFVDTGANRVQLQYPMGSTANRNTKIKVEHWAYGCKVWDMNDVLIASITQSSTIGPFEWYPVCLRNVSGFKLYNCKIVDDVQGVVFDGVINKNGLYDKVSGSYVNLTGWTVHGDYTEPFYVENISGEVNTLSIAKNNASAPTLTVEYSTDRTNWSTLGTTDTTAITYTIPVNGRVYLRCSTNAWGASSYRNQIVTSGYADVGGNIMSLLYGSGFTGNERTFPSGSTNTFAYLFYNNNHLINASNLLLPATTLANYCYQYMFYGCTSLVTAPELPATTLTPYCYEGMFSDCTSLTTAPVLPAPVLVAYCYSNMFYGCSNLVSVKCLANNLAEYMTGLAYWLSNVSPTGTFTKKAGVTWPSGASGIPSGWTVQDA